MKECSSHLSYTFWFSVGISSIVYKNRLYQVHPTHTSLFFPEPYVSVEILLIWRRVTFCIDFGLTYMFLDFHFHQYTLRLFPCSIYSSSVSLFCTITWPKIYKCQKRGHTYYQCSNFLKLIVHLFVSLVLFSEVKKS